MLHLTDQDAKPMLPKAELPCSIRNLWLALFHGERPERQFVVMTAYFDESGTHGASSPATVFGGFIASAQQWSDYEQSLSDILNNFGVKVLHAKDYRQRKKDFKNMPSDKYEEFTSLFLKLVDDYISAGFIIEVRSMAYKELYRPRFYKKKLRPDSEYGLCFRAALERSLIFIAEMINEWPLNLILESGHRNSGDALRIYEEIKSRNELRYSLSLGSISFSPKKQCLPLAASDLLVYSAFRRIAGFSYHPHPDAVPVGPASPPYYVAKCQLSRIVIDSETLDYISHGLF